MLPFFCKEKISNAFHYAPAGRCRGANDGNTIPDAQGFADAAKHSKPEALARICNETRFRA
jgi:hypothetical protein